MTSARSHDDLDTVIVRSTFVKVVNIFVLKLEQATVHGESKVISLAYKCLFSS